MSYPGNSSLAAEIQDRILTTFEQTLDLAGRGELREAGIGCDFILRLDPMFEPASRLKERLHQADGELLVDDLRLADRPAPEPTASGDVFELTSREAPAAPPVSPDAPQQPPAAGGGAEEVFSDVDARELEAALDWGALTRPAGGTDAGEPEPGGAEAPETAAPTQPPAPPALDSPAPVGDSAPADPEMPAGEPIAALDSESEQRIQELLGEGQGAFEKGQYQSAIDAWSRIFLVDIDHQEASRRIELARKLKAEVERQVEELFHEAVSQVEAGDFDAARASFGQVLELQPSHLAAQEYLDKLDAGTIAAQPEPPAAAPEAPPAPADETLSIPDELTAPLSELDALPTEALQLDEDLAETPAEPAAERRPSRPRPAPAAAKPAGVKRSFLYIGGAVLLVAVAGGWFLWRNFDDTFPNAGQEAPAVARPRVDVIARAQQVFSEGNTDLAIAQLKRLPPNHPRYAEAQALIAQWETPAEPAAPAAAASAEQLAERDRLVGEARAAFEERQFLRSHRMLTQAAAVTALDDEGLQLQTAAALELQPLRSEIEIFRQGEWAEALRSLWQMRENDPGNPDVRQLMVDSYFNLGVRELQRRDPAAAAENLEEALTLAGSDPEIERLLDFARTYQGRPVDLLYRIFVKYLPFR